jgi:tRNA A37 threonylcarbamoyladenosine biosynthesis protein TsaE
MAEVADLALGELLEDRAVVLVEWGDVIANALGPYLEVRLLHADGEVDEDLDEVRKIELRSVGKQWASRWERLEADLANWAVPAC